MEKKKQKQKQKQICISDELPTLSSDYPWLLAQNMEPQDDKGQHIFYTVHDPVSHYRCRIPELVGRRIRATFHGWMILSKHPHDIEWSLWNPVTSEFIHLPPLILQDGQSTDIGHCCLSSPPNVPDSVLLLTRYSKRNFVYCKLDRKAKRLIWIEMSYSEQLKTLTHNRDCFLLEPTYCNGKIYAWANLCSPHIAPLVVQIHITVKRNEVTISLLPFVNLPNMVSNGDWSGIFLKASCTELFTIIVGVMKTTPVDVYFYKLDMNSMAWIKSEDLKDTVIFVDLNGHDSVYSSPPMASKLGGYIHFLQKVGKAIYSYNVEDKTISMSSIRCLNLPPRSETSSLTVWPGMPEFRFEGDNEEAKCKDDLNQVEGKGDELMVVKSATNAGKKVVQTYTAYLLNISVDVLETLMKYCVGIEYLHFRATCKLCRLAAPTIRWSNEGMRLQTYSLDSPWLMTLDKDGGIMTFLDPMFGDDKYFIRASPEFFYDGKILCSRYGWLLLFIEDGRLAFFNPFTTDIRKLPQMSQHELTLCFSAPPTSPDCIVVGFSPKGPWNLCIHLIGQPSWHRIILDFGGGDPYSFFLFPTLFGRDVYSLYKEGGLEVFRAIDDHGNFFWDTVVDEAAAPKRHSAEYFQSKCDEHHLLVILGEFGESVEVFELIESTKDWEKVDSLGRHTIYICDTSCVCMDAKTPEMENKIYFSRLNSENGKIVFYSMETRRFHTFNGRNVEQNDAKDLFGTKQRVIYTQAWIEPTWS